MWEEPTCGGSCVVELSWVCGQRNGEGQGGGRGGGRGRGLYVRGGREWWGQEKGLWRVHVVLEFVFYNIEFNSSVFAIHRVQNS